jgi:arylsulfatase A-like enzyme
VELPRAGEVARQRPAKAFWVKRARSASPTGRRTFAGMTSAMDDAVGRVLDTLRRLGL